MNYAVAYLNFFDNDLQIISIEADDPITAMIEGARELMGASDDDEWLNDQLKNIPSSDGYPTRIEEIKEAFFNTDQVIAVMPM
jgi:hypothetical protein